MRTPRSSAVNAFKHVWHHGGLVGLARRLQGRRGAILRYHSVTDDESATLGYLDSGLMVTTAAFQSQLKYVKRHYTVVPLDEMVDRIHAGRSLPRHAAAITFDDGYRDNYTQAYRLLRAEGLPATFYVTTGALDGGPPLWTAKLRYMVRTSPREQVVLPAGLGSEVSVRQPAERQAVFTSLIVALKHVPSTRRCELVEELAVAFGVSDFSALDGIMMSWDELREMSGNGMTIGAHTVSHPNLPKTDVEEATREVCQSRDMIADQLGISVPHFSYPNGRGAAHMNDSVREIVRRAGFRSAVTSLPGCVEVGADPWTLKRVGIYNRHRDLRSFSLDVERARLKTA